MGDPNTGEIYEGELRKEDDIPLDASQAAFLRSLSPQQRIHELGLMREQMKAEVARSKENLLLPDLRTLEGARSFLDYHNPDDEQLRAHHEVNLRFQELLQHVWLEIPSGPGKTVFIRDLNRARMSANSAIANHGA